MLLSFFKRVISYIFILFFCGAVPLAAQQSAITHKHPERPPTMKELLQWKEVFTYEVRYSFFKLGEVKTRIVRDTTYQGDRLWWLQSKIISNPSIPFMGKEVNHYNTFFVATDSLPYTEVYWRDNVDEKEFQAERYDFDYKHHKVYFSRAGEPVDTLQLNGPATSGQLSFYYGRLFAGTKQPFTLPVYLEGKKGSIYVTNTRKTEMREYKAFDEPVKTYYSEGHADIDGPFGFSGDFKSWYMADDLRIPLEAHAKVWLGNVKVRLIDYKKVPRNP